MRVRFKKLTDDAILPAYAKPGDAGLDLTCTATAIDDQDNLVCHTGIAAEIHEGYVGLLFPRSSICKYPLSQTNSVGVLDSGYRGEIIFKFKKTEPYAWAATYKYKAGDRIGQLVIVPIPKIEPEWADELSETERGGGGYGSTGN